MENKPIEILSIGERRVVNSYEYYKATGHTSNNYTRWMMETVLLIGEPGKDFFPCPENVNGRTIRFRLRYYFDLDFAISLCVNVKGARAREMRRFLKSFLTENK